MFIFWHFFVVFCLENCRELLIVVLFFTVFFIWCWLCQKVRQSRLLVSMVSYFWY